MAFIPTANAVRVAFQGSVNSNDAVVTMWFLGAAPASSSDLIVLAGFLDDWWVAEIEPLQSNGYQLDSIYLLAQDSSLAPFYTYTTGMPHVGSVNSPVIEPQTAPVIKFATSARGRSGRGRNYFPGCPLSAESSPGVVSGTFKTAVLAAYLAVATYLSSSTYDHVVVSHQNSGVVLSAGVARFVAAYDMVSNSTGTQRRRRIGVGA